MNRKLQLDSQLAPSALSNRVYALKYLATMSSANVLAARDVNTSMPTHGQNHTETDGNTKPDVMSMEHHRQVFQSKMEQGEYVVSAHR